VDVGADLDLGACVCICVCVYVCVYLEPDDSACPAHETCR